MLKFAANLSMMYTEHAFLDRYAAAPPMVLLAWNACRRMKRRRPSCASA